MTIKFSTIFLFLTSIVIGNELAIIKDADGYTNVRLGAGTNYEIVMRIEEDQYFSAPRSEKDWIILQIGSDRGFIHKSRVQYISDLPLDEQKKRLYGIYADLGLALDSTPIMELRKPQLIDNEIDYGIGYYSHDIMVRLFCQSEDDKVLMGFLDLVPMDGAGGAIIGQYVAKCFSCRPKVVRVIMREYSLPEWLIAESLNYQNQERYNTLNSSELIVFLENYQKLCERVKDSPRIGPIREDIHSVAKIRDVEFEYVTNYLPLLPRVESLVIDFEDTAVLNAYLQTLFFDQVLDVGDYIDSHLYPIGKILIEKPDLVLSVLEEMHIDQVRQVSKQIMIGCRFEVNGYKDELARYARYQARMDALIKRMAESY